MALVSFLTPKYSNRLISSYSSLATNNTEKSQEKGYILYKFQSPTSYQNLVYSSFSSRNRRLETLVPFDAKKSGSKGEDHRALDTVLKLYNAIKKKNKSFASFQTLQGRMVLYVVLNMTKKIFGNHVQLVVKPTLFHGFSFKLEWSKLPGHTLHVDKGKVYIRNLETFVETLLHFEPFRLKLMEYVTNMMDNMDTNKELIKSKAKSVIFVLLTMFLIVVCLFL